MASNAEINWTSNDAAVVRSFQKIEKGLDETARRMERLENASKRQTATIAGGFDGIGASVGRLGTALIGGGVILTGVNSIREGIRKAREEAEEAGKAFDEMFRAYRVQAGLTDVEGEKAQARILAVARQNAVSPAVATAGARGLVSAGFANEEATGGALNALLRTQAAYVAAGKPVDAQNLAKQSAAYLTSQGLPSTEANLTKAMQDAFALRAGAFELADFGALGKEGATFKGKLSQQEQLAAFGVLVDAMGSAESGTALRTVVSRLTTASVGRTSKRALDMLGLKATDVDLVGENFSTVLDRLAGGLDKLPEEQRAAALKLLFEEANVAPASLLINERGGKYAKYQAGMGPAAAEFNKAADEMQRGRAAAEARLSGVNQAGRAAEDAGDDLVVAALEAEGRARGLGPFGRFVDWTFYKSARLLPGVSQERALEFIRERGHRTFTEDVLRRAQLAAGGELPPQMTTADMLTDRELRARAVEIFKQRQRIGAGFAGDYDPDKFESGVARIVEELRKNTEATKDNTRKAGGGVTVHEPASAALGAIR